MKTRIGKAGFTILFFFIALLPGRELSTEAPKPGKARSADNVEIVYTAQGSGKTAIIFIHGGFADHSFWSNQVAPFSRKYRVIALDLAGHGQSGKNRNKWNILMFAEDVRAVMEKEKIQQAVLVGNSLGGPVALETARLVPDKIVGIVAVDTFQLFLSQLPPDLIKGQVKALRSDFAGTMKKFARDVFHKDVDPKLLAYVEKKMLNNSEAVGVGMMESFFGYNMIGTLKKLNLPIRCINGDMYPTQVEKNRAIYADFDAVILPRCGHYPMLEQPELFNRHLEEILEKMGWRKPK
jgi:pimeloyl-ACP methyl ester carboxylesterase